MCSRSPPCNLGQLITALTVACFIVRNMSWLLSNSAFVRLILEKIWKEAGTGLLGATVFPIPFGMVHVALSLDYLNLVTAAQVIPFRVLCLKKRCPLSQVLLRVCAKNYAKYTLTRNFPTPYIYIYYFFNSNMLNVCWMRMTVPVQISGIT